MSITQLKYVPRRVDEIMTANVLTVDENDSLWDAWQMMFVSGHRHLAVLSGTACIGIIADRSLLGSVIVTEARLTKRRVAELLNRAHVWSLSPESSIHEASLLMATHRINALPVIDSAQRLCGIVTSTDLISWIAQQ